MKLCKNKSDNALKTISEAAETLNIPTHVLRFWESKFNIIKPVKYNNRRYYNSSNLDLIKKIKNLLYEQHYTIAEAIMYFKNNKPNPALRDISLFPTDLINNNKNTIKSDNIQVLIDTKDKLILAKNKLNALL